MAVTIIIRSRNDADIIEMTLKGVLEQSFQDVEVINFDNGSTDGTVEKIKQFTTKIVPVPEGSYIPGRVLNKAVELSASEIIVFLNSDCVPVNKYWLENLVKPFEDPAVGAVFSRQVAAEDSLPIIKIDTERAFGDGEEHKKWEHFFSMASSALRKILWMNDRFDEGMLISEDMEWSYRIRKKGHKVIYAKDSIVEHHHHYSVKDLYHRHLKEGIDSVKIFSINGSSIGLFLKVFLYPLAYAIARDIPDLMKNFSWKDVFTMPAYRLVLFWGRFKGTKKGIALGSKGSRVPGIK
ncbi:MAG: glycosyltransferase [Deltaproteobacteria bacterium]|nr:glycosyltransferase [Deltaproteobacteria bacterium]